MFLSVSLGGFVDNCPSFNWFSLLEYTLTTTSVVPIDVHLFPLEFLLLLVLY